MALEGTAISNESPVLVGLGVSFTCCSMCSGTLPCLLCAKSILSCVCPSLLPPRKKGEMCHRIDTGKCNTFLRSLQADLELRDSVQEAKGGQGDKLVLQVELPTFPHAVVYQQAATAPATPADMAASSDCGGPTLSLIPDPEVLISRSLQRPEWLGRPLA